MTVADPKDRNKRPTGERQQSLLDIATSFYKLINDAKGDDREYQIDDFHGAIRKRLLQGQATEEEIVEIFEQRHSQYAELFLKQGSSLPNTLHAILQRLGRQLPAQRKDDNKDDKTAAARLFLQYLTLEYPEVLRQQDDDYYTPLERAAKRSKPVFFLIGELIVPKETLDALGRNKCDCDKTSKLASAQSKQDAPTPCSIRLNEILEKRFQKPREAGGSRCLRHIIDGKRLAESDKKLRGILKEVLRGTGDESNGSSRTTCLHNLLEDDTIFTMDNAKEIIETFQRLIGICHETLIEVRNSEGFTPLHKAIQLYKSDNFDFQLLNEVINKLIQHSPTSMYSKVQGSSEDNNKTPFMLLQALTPKANSNPKYNKSDCHKSIQRVLKHHCIGGTRGREEKLEYLYGDLKNAPKLFLDLAHVHGGVNKQYVEMLSQKVNQSFDTALDYVRLPRIQETPNKPQSGSENNAQNRGSPPQHVEQDPYAKIFGWLKTKKVEKIFKVIVDDLGDRTHSDEVIVEALKPFDVEVWDWRKFDMCSDTIQRAAPNVRHVFLHASGNNAVLRSWSCERGLAQLKNLQTVTITMYPGKRESRETLEKYLKDFKENFALHNFALRRDIRPGDVIIQGLDDQSNPRPFQDRTMILTNAVQQSENAWVTNLTPFRKSLEDWFDDEDNGPSVKIALIDNGVNIRHEEVGNITMGESFYGPSAGQSGFREYFADPSAHGTQMAICIRKVCPMAKLYVARLDDSKGQFTVSSATQAIEWAVKRGVDIISMSWTFNQKKHPNHEETKAFKAAIEEAAKKNKLLFAALNDAEPNSDVGEFYPVGLKDVFKIGSAKKWGANADFPESGKSDYLFPGQDIELQDLEGETMSRSGSSLATAFAAGMAGLILYSMEVHKLTGDSEVPEEIREKRLKDAKTKDGMSKIFNILGENPASGTHKDVPVAFKKQFPQAGHMLKDEKMRMLRGFLTRISPEFIA